MFNRALLGAVSSFGVYLAVASLARAEAVPLKEGTYHCFTITTMLPPATLPTDLSEVNRAALGNKIRPMVAPQLLLAPAAFGAVILDGKGSYRMTGVRSAGKYGFNEGTSRPTFTGDLGAMKQGAYSGTGTSFIVAWEGMSFQCVLAGSSEAGQTSPAAVERDRVFKASAGPVLNTAAAAEFNGEYEGGYSCGQVATRLHLALTAKLHGELTGVLSFGGMQTPEVRYSVGSFSLKGEWKGSHFKLKGNQWIKQPAGYVMVDIEGDLTTLGSSGQVLYPGCNAFAVKRVGSIAHD